MAGASAVRAASEVPALSEAPDGPERSLPPSDAFAVARPSWSSPLGPLEADGPDSDASIEPALSPPPETSLPAESVDPPSLDAPSLPLLSPPLLSLPLESLLPPSLPPLCSVLASVALSTRSS